MSAIHEFGETIAALRAQASALEPPQRRDLVLFVIMLLLADLGTGALGVIAELVLLARPGLSHKSGAAK